MMKHEVLNLDLIVNQKFAVLTLYNTIFLIAKILHLYFPVWQIGDFDMGIWFQISRAHFPIRSSKVGISLIFNLSEFIPMGITKIACNSIKGTGMGHSLILSKTQEALQRSSPKANTCLTLYIK